MTMDHPPKDKGGVKIGMWLFIYTEIMLFGGLFVLYAAYYSRHTASFIENAKHLSTALGTVNTVVLLVSSFTVAAAITAIHRKNKRGAILLAAGTVVLGLVFLVNKYFEWGHKIRDGIYPGSDTLLDVSPGTGVFYGLYYAITGLHGIHILIGLILLTVSIYGVAANRIHSGDYGLLENSGLYWHLVDLIWIFIFPLFYLIL